ncbi:M28 family peptidase [Jiangella mangrovi]|uniref:Zn-dependent M28 family amino/carboxypeptidase n=1 Tax=Jiangella mangrovi TaxID=1524084 RepID=A0A7W9GQQ1_9ACTN|nr:M28 family peptidase [Jiangella mangrovi]MBB5788011.1 Zn-dependent M28 family amino/carboxypeptidase [Jiangella mangrovi]
MKRSAAWALGTTGALILAVAPLASAAKPADSTDLRNAVTSAGILEHLEAFQDIADANGGTRASGTPGYDASLQYVKAQLEAAGYQTTVQPFLFDVFEELAAPAFERVSPEPVTYTEADDFLTMEYSGSGDVTGTLVPTTDILVPPPAQPGSSSGCEPADFVPASATEPQVALVQRGTCDFTVKAENAQSAGYDAVVIFNEGQEGRTETLAGTLGADTQATIPVIGTSFAVGADLYARTQAGPVTVHVETSTLITHDVPTANLLATTGEGRSDRQVVVGAHLDSVAAGEGINDNGSGSAQNLEIALQLAALDVTPRNQVVFAWWGAEESGLIGSQFYVDSLTPRQVKNTAVNLNFDMVGSPNYVRFVYDGDASDTASLGSTGSGVVEDVFVDYFGSQGLETEPTAFDGRSDYDAFITAGIPAGGLFTGAEGVKTAEEAAIYGGTAGLAYDPCYHQECDDITNLSEQALDEMSDAAAHATLTFAMTTSAIEGTGKGEATGQSTADFRGSHLLR